MTLGIQYVLKVLTHFTMGPIDFLAIQYQRQYRKTILKVGISWTKIKTNLVQYIERD